MPYFRTLSHNFRTPLHKGLNRRPPCPCLPCFQPLVSALTASLATAIQHFCLFGFVFQRRTVDLIDFVVEVWCFNATFSNISAISWRPGFVVEEAGVSGESHRKLASNW